MDQHQVMSKTLSRTQASANHRIGMMQALGHHTSIEATTESVTITITRREGYAHHITTTPHDLPQTARNAPAYARHPQSVLLAYALHAAADWSAQADRAQIAYCIGGPEHQGTTATYNPSTGEYDWYCPSCLYGEAA